MDPVYEGVSSTIVNYVREMRCRAAKKDKDVPDPTYEKYLKDYLETDAVLCELHHVLWMEIQELSRRPLTQEVVEAIQKTTKELEELNDEVLTRKPDRRSLSVVYNENEKEEGEILY